MDLKNILEENEDIKNNPNVKVQKPIQLKDIEEEVEIVCLKKIQTYLKQILIK